MMHYWYRSPEWTGMACGETGMGTVASVFTENVTCQRCRHTLRFFMGVTGLCREDAQRYTQDLTVAEALRRWEGFYSKTEEPMATSSKDLGVKAVNVGNNIWHLINNADTRSYDHISLSGPHSGGKAITVAGPYTRVVGLIMEAWSVEQGGPGQFSMVVNVTQAPVDYKGDDAFVAVTAMFL